jgi:hypothetical protein
MAWMLTLKVSSHSSSLFLDLFETGLVRGVVGLISPYSSGSPARMSALASRRGDRMHWELTL